MRLFTRRSAKIGQPPGTVDFVGDAPATPATLTITDLYPDRVERTTPEALPAALAPPPGVTVRWINLDGVHDEAMVQQIGALAHIHPLVLEDIANTGQRPKLETFDDYLFAVVKMLRLDVEETIDAEQVSLIVQERLVISFQERAGDVFDPVRRRLDNATGRLRTAGADYFA